MTVQELIDELNGFDPEMEVRFAYNYGDHWNTQVAANPREIYEGQIVYSSYHNRHKVTEDEEGTKVLIIQ